MQCHASTVPLLPQINSNMQLGLVSSLHNHTWLLACLFQCRQRRRPLLPIIILPFFLVCNNVIRQHTMLRLEGRISVGVPLQASVPFQQRHIDRKGFEVLLAVTSRPFQWSLIAQLTPASPTELCCPALAYATAHTLLLFQMIIFH